MIGKVLFVVSTLVALATPAIGVPLSGRYDAFVDAAATCVQATGPAGVDRSAIAAAGWPGASSAETDEKQLSWAYSKRNPFILRIDVSDLGESEGCWFVAEIKKQRDFDKIRTRLERRMGRPPDAVDNNDMRGTRWNNPRSNLELWMMPANKLCFECPQIFVTVRPRRAD